MQAPQTVLRVANRVGMAAPEGPAFAWCEDRLFQWCFSPCRYPVQVLKGGASGYVPKSAADAELIEAIRAVRNGRVYLRPRDVQMLLTDYLKAEESTGQGGPLQHLSSREREVLSLTARGFSSREIGDRLFISPKTVDTYRQRVMEKLGLEKRSELIAFALSRGLLQE